MSNNLKPVIVQRVTHFPTTTQVVHGMLTGSLAANPKSMWVALGVNSQEIVAHNTDKAALLAELTLKKYVVKKILNEWN